MAENRELALVLKLVADQFQSELKKSGGVVGEFNKFISDWKVQLTAVGGALFAVAKSTANYGEELLKTSQKIGIKVEALAGLQHAANLADLSNESLSKGLKTLSVNMVEAARQTGDGEALFRRLGVSATDATGQLRPTEQVLLDLADVFANSKDGAGKAEVAVKLFGKAGLDLIPFLNQGRAGIKELMAEAERLGLVMSQQDAEAANRFNDEIKKLEGATRGLTLQLGKELIPGFTQLLKAMTDLTAGSVGSLFKLEIQGWASIFTLLNHAIRETGLEIDVFLKKMGKSDSVKKFWDDVLVQSRKALDSDTAKKLNQIFTPSAAAPGAPSTGSQDNDKKDLAAGPDLAKLKADYQLYITGITAMGEEKLKKDREGFQLYITGLQSAGQEHLAALKGTGDEIVEKFKVNQDNLNKERDILSQNAQAWIDYHTQVGGSTQLRYDKDLELLTGNLSKQLDLTTSETARLLEAWQTHDSQVADDILAKTTLTATQRETIELQSLTKIASANQRASDDVVGGWARGMQDYVRQTGNGFNLATDMARQTAQTMEQGFKTFFFDAMAGKIQSLKDVFKSLLNFAKQIIAQISSQLVTKQILSLVTSFSGAGGAAGAQTVLSGPTQAATGGEIVRRFAGGGPVPGFGTGDTVPALLTPGEFVLSRRDVSDIKRGIVGGGGSPINIAITVNAGGGAQQSGTGSAPNFAQLARDISRLVESKLIDEQRPGGLLAGGVA